MPRTSSESIVFVISGPSGSGKTTLWKRLLEEFKDITRSVSVTTRPPRGKEKNGRDYTFVSEKKFLKMIEKGEFLEWALVHNHYYGTPRKNIEIAKKKGIDIILEIDVQGAMKIKKSGIKAVFIFIAPPSIKALKNRLKKRGDVSEEEIRSRIEIAKKEMSYISEYDYLIINKDINSAYNHLKSIITAERLKTFRAIKSLKI